MSTPSLLDYLEAPVLVGDPDGRVVYVNPAFESRFDVRGGSVMGGSLASLFEGGAREATLRAVADVCGGGRSVRFQLREGGAGYSAIASPISAADDRVGVVLLLTDELSGDDRLVAAVRTLQSPIDEIARCVAEFSDQVGGKRDPRYVEILQDAVRAVEQLRKQAEELQSLLLGSSVDR